MMDTKKVCASCCEIVYPLEVIRCFDQIWHRRCFRCQHCGMALSICNYHGYDKKPYCAAHNPKPTSFTFIPDTPELLRVTNNTRMFSSANSMRSGRSSGFDERYSPQSHRRSISYYNNHGQSYTPPPTRFGLNNQCTSPHTFTSSSGINSRSLSNSNTCHLKIDPINHHHHYDQGHSPPPPSQNGLSRSGSCHSVIITPTGLPPGNNANIVGGNVGSTENINIPRGSTVNLNFHGPAHQNFSNTGFGGTFVAQYSYEAKEDDEVTFKSGDVIVNGEPISEGWMYGTVQRTGKFGMLPSNYVKLYR
ncbi:LIM and SH3 domain protein isoform 6 [Schistosoma japonicum]|uniref:LIM and SH3 domain protein isoform 6 n=1 Tax=Schistosoma japonicum TaxID=6182 RepID=A0A4Z2DGF7_SCHJA|nr:LIM and SH3 domain protein isoform 6 [Schistosoma japonicum]